MSDFYTQDLHSSLQFSIDDSTLLDVARLYVILHVAAVFVADMPKNQDHR